MDKTEIANSLLARPYTTSRTQPDEDHDEDSRRKGVATDPLPSDTDLTVHRRVVDRLAPYGIRLIETEAGFSIQGEHGTMRFWEEYGKEKKRGPVGRAIAKRVWEVRNEIHRRQLQKQKS